EARAAASLFVQLVRAGTGNRVGLVSFSTTASSPVDFPLANVTAGSKNTLIGPSPFTGGIMGGLAPGGSTTIGGGLNAAYGQLPPGGPNSSFRNVLLFTDGLQNTPPMVDPANTIPDRHSHRRHRLWHARQFGRRHAHSPGHHSPRPVCARRYQF